MNCKPGMLAIVVSEKPHYNGRIVEVLCAPPGKEFRLPDGHPARHDDPRPSWVLKFIGGPVVAPLVGGGSRMASFGVGADEKLRPLPGNSEDEQIEDELTIS